MIRLTLVAGSALALAAALPALAQNGPTSLVLPEGTLLDISAEGTSTRVPDLALVQAGVVTQAANAAEAMQQNSARMAAVLAGLDLFITADCGVMHLGVAAGVTTIGLFRVTALPVYAPYGGHNAGVDTGNCSGRETARHVLGMVATTLGYRRCG